MRECFSSVSGSACARQRTGIRERLLSGSKGPITMFSTDDLSVVGVAPHFEFHSLRMMFFLVPTFFLVFSICALYDNVRSSVTQRYTGGLQCVKFTPFQLMLSCLPHSRFRRWKRLTCAFIGFSRSWFVV